MFFFDSESLAFHAVVQLSPAMYTQILEECDEVARDYAMGKEHTATIKNNQDD